MVDEKTAKHIEDTLAKVLVDLEGLAESSPLKAVPVHIEPVVAEVRALIFVELFGMCLLVIS